jgi:thiol-disulfide isomerase/thioredoxin
MDTQVVALGAVLAAQALVIVAAGLRGLVTGKPLVYRSRWVAVLIALGFSPSLLMTADMWSRPDFDRELLLLPLVWIVSLVAMWLAVRGYTFLGVDAESFQEALRHALQALAIPFEETLSSVRLRDAEGGTLTVNIQPWTGTAALTIAPRKRQPVLNSIAAEMRRHFALTPVKANHFSNVLHLVLGLLFLVVVATGVRFMGRLSHGRSHSEWANRAAPDFHLRTLAGDKRRLSDEIGRRVVLVNFFATWCGPCRGEIPELIRLQREHEAQGLVVLGIDADEDPEAVRAFARELGITYPVGIDRGWIRGNYRVAAFPTTVLVGADGKIVDYRTGGRVDEALTSAIDRELASVGGRTDDAREVARAAWSTQTKGAIPERLSTPRVVEDRLGLRKSAFLEYEVGGELITDIQVGSSRAWPQARALIADREGARLVDGDGRSVKEWRVPTMRFPKIVRAGADLGEWLLVDDGVWDEIKAVSSDGRVRWTRSGAGAYYGAAAGALDGADVEFVVWRFDAPGLEVLNDRGRLVRKLEAPDPVRDVRIVDQGSQGRASILYSILDRDLVELDPSGRVLARRKPDAPALNFLWPVRWTALAPQPLFIQTYWDTLNILKPSGERVTTLRAPSLDQQLLSAPLRAVEVRFPGKPDPYLVVVVRLYYHPRTVLHVFDREGALVYHELLEDQYAGLGVLTGPSGEAEAFLLGGEGHVLRYALVR